MWVKHGKTISTTRLTGSGLYQIFMVMTVMTGRPRLREKLEKQLGIPAEDLVAVDPSMAALSHVIV